MYSKNVKVMKKTILTAVLALGAIAAAHAGVPTVNSTDVRISNLSVERVGNDLQVAFNLDASGISMKSNQEVDIYPVITNQDNLETLPPVYITGRNRMYYHLRNDGSEYVKDVNMYHNGKDAANISYSTTLPYQQWMNLSELSLVCNAEGCANCRDASVNPIATLPLAQIDMRPAFYEAEYIYTAPAGDGIKTRKASGTAYIDFPVNVMTINPDFRNNAVELNKIQNSIDKVKSDKDYTITGISIKGFASPEGPYDNNERLAKGRAEALLNYVKGLYNFPKSVKFTSSYVAENWAGLREWVASNQVENKEAILGVIDDTSLTPDQKDAKMKTFSNYQWILDNVYPGLRKSDYEVNYTVREFTDVNEIIGLVQTSPEKLGMNEFYLAAQNFEPGSDAYCQIFETAVKYYPDNEVANLNAANSAMSKGNLKAAKGYLDKAGNSQEAYYARGVYDALTKNYQSALSNFAKAPKVAQAKKAAERVKVCIDRPEGHVKVTPVQ